MTHITLLPIIIFVFCTVAGIAGCITLQRREIVRQKKIQILCKKIESALKDGECIKQRPVFADSLEHVAMTTKFQQPRLELQTGKSSGIPEKYKFFSGLIARGMSTDEISEILGISLAEAGQLATLSFISRKRGC